MLTFGQYLRAARKRYGYTQDDVAKKLGYKSFTTVQKWESDAAKPPIDKLNALCELFHIRMADLFSGGEGQEDLSQAFKETGERVRRCRIEKKLTLEELGAMVGVGKSTVRKWEAGAFKSIGADHIQKLSEALGKPADYLLGKAPVEAAAASDNERDLLEDYRKLSKLGKLRAHERILELLEQESNS